MRPSSFPNRETGRTMSKHDVSYFQFRAEWELALAQRATHPAVVKAHYQLAELYLDRVHQSADDEDDRASSVP